MIETGTVLQNRYLIEKQIGAGGMGAVYLAVDQRFDNHVAIKETFFKDKELSAAFEREARLLNGLHHFVLPHVTDYFLENGGHFLVMQYIEGEDLSEAVKQGNKFPVETVLQWTDSLLDALEYLHSQNPPITHRDIKPQNLKITSRGGIILLDFGLAKLKSEDSTAQSVFGYSRHYSPLEQIQGIGTDSRSDIFSLAATVYYLLTGEPPVDVLNRAAAIVGGKKDPLRMANEIRNEISVRVAAVLNSALALNSAERFESAQAMREALKTASVEEIDRNIGSEATVALDKNLSLKTSASQNFPALAAFAAANSSSLPSNKNGENNSAVPIISDSQKQVIYTSPPDSTDFQTHVSAVQTKSRTPIIVGLILLLCGALTAAYFINKSRVSKQSPAVEISESNSNTSATNSSLPKSAAAQQAAEVAATENPVEKNLDLKKESAESGKVEKAPTVDVKKTPAPQSVVTNTPYKEPRKVNNSAERNADDQYADEDNPDDSTGNPRERRRQQWLRRQERRSGQIIEMSEDEWRDYQRRQRRPRVNRDDYPY